MNQVNQETQKPARPQRRDGYKRRRLIVPGLIFVLLFVIVFSLGVASITPKRYELLPGDKAPENIIATAEIEDKSQTDLLEEAARSRVASVYYTDQNVVETTLGEAEAVFQGLDNLIATAERIYRNQAQAGETAPALSADDWSELLTAQDYVQLRALVRIELSDLEIVHVLAAGTNSLSRLRDAVIPKLTLALENGLQEENVEQTKSACQAELRATTLAEPLKSIGGKLINAYIVPTQFEDKGATEAERAKAAQEVEPVVIVKGSVIVAGGQTLSEGKIEVMRSLGLIRPADADTIIDIGVAVYVLLVLVFFFGYLLVYHVHVLNDPKKIFMTGLLMAVVAAAGFFTAQVSPHIHISLYAALLCALMISRRVALMANIAVGLLSVLLVQGRQDLFGHESIMVLISIIVGGSVCICFSNKMMSRSKLMLAGALAAAAAALCVAAMDMISGEPALQLLQNVAWAAGGNLVATILVIGTMPLWESAFDVATSARLIELSNANHPLLKQLMIEAPGTYHHSMMVASLCEGAAEEIGANPLLARVGGYYHDVGKLRRPGYFAENQHGDNPLEKLPPHEAAAIVIAHVKDGVAMCQRNKLPSKVISLVAEHHGNTPVAYFYHKALKENAQASIKNFRYPGGRPASKEAVIVMLADSVEAAVRSLPEQTPELVGGMVGKIIRGKLEDEQLSAAPLTLLELAAVERSFLQTFGGLLHERVEYPAAMEPAKQK